MSPPIHSTKCPADCITEMEVGGGEVKSGQGRNQQYPTWLANMIMVRKSSGKWWMCTYYTNLNKASPKDPYQLLNIDRLVDGASGFVLLSFMDAYSGYNQIRMHPHDEFKIAFIINSRTF
ncbi:hypothetical protein CR513_18414, partial [Mucuna pruriens]